MTMTTTDLSLLEEMYLDSLDSEYYAGNGYFLDDDPYNPNLPYVRNDVNYYDED